MSVSSPFLHSVNKLQSLVCIQVTYCRGFFGSLTVLSTGRKERRVESGALRAAPTGADGRRKWLFPSCWWTALLWKAVSPGGLIWVWVINSWLCKDNLSSLFVFPCLFPCLGLLAPCYFLPLIRPWVMKMVDKKKPNFCHFIFISNFVKREKILNNLFW